MVKIAIIGGGKGGTTIMNAFHGIDEFEIVGICDTNSDAPGIVLARELGVSVFTDLLEILKQPEIGVIIEATGNAKVREIVSENKAKGVKLIDSDVASIMMTFTNAHDRVVKQARNKKGAFKTSAPFLVKTHGTGRGNLFHH